LKINDQTGIESRAVVDMWNDPRWHLDDPPAAEVVDTVFRLYGTQLAKAAALKALHDAGIDATSITHIVSVTATSSGSRGYDQLVARELGVPETAERVLLNGIGCAGGLAALRVASNLATAAAYRGQKARVLVVACEICSTQIRGELHAASESKAIGIGPALFSDGASALVLCNSHALSHNSPKRFSVVDWCTQIVPETGQEMSYNVTSHGFQLSLSKNVPSLASTAVKTPFQNMVMKNDDTIPVPHSEFDWALHPGGLAIIKGVQMSLGLPDRALRATSEIYRTRGNTSSVSVLAVLDKIRTLEDRRKDVIACSFGPGLTVEMARLKQFL
jgi:type III polyketide synthase